jgi:CheY-like chemotaxis protein
MLTQPVTNDTSRFRTSRATAVQKVVMVNGTPELLELFETLLDSGNYDMVFVESTDHAYSQIKHVQPNLVILCVHLDEPNGFQLLSMLKLDEETRAIPVLTFSPRFEGQQPEEEPSEPSDAEMFSPKPALRMN